MPELVQMLGMGISILFATAVKYRLSGRVLERRYSPAVTAAVMIAGDLVSGWVNLHFQIAGTPVENVVYYAAWSLLVFEILYRGERAKIVFVVSLLHCSSQALFMVVTPVCLYLSKTVLETLINNLEIAGVFFAVIWGVVMEVVGIRLQNLRQEMPAGYTYFLSALMYFVYAAVFSAQEITQVRYDGALPFAAVIACVLYSAMGVAVIAVATFSVDRLISFSLERQQRVLQETYWKGREEEWKKMAGFRHDMKNHLLCLEHLLNQGKTEQAASYMGTLTDTVGSLESLVRTGNDYGDALMGIKCEEAQKKGISVTVDMELPREGWLAPSDLCSLLSNGMDNAIFGCMQVEDTKPRWIKASSFLRQNQLVIEIRNSKSDEVRVRDGQVFPERRRDGHGLGLLNVRAIADRYHGTFQILEDSGFVFCVMIPGNHL